MKKLLTLFILLLFSYYNYSQTISPQVLSTSGRNYSNSGYSLSWTLGQSVAISFNSSNNILSQGFQQPYYKNNSGITENTIDNNILFYPNPVMDVFIVDVNSSNLYYREAQLYDVLGKCIKTFNIQNIEKVTIDMRNINPGIYFLKLFNLNQTYQKTIKVTKI